MRATARCNLVITQRNEDGSVQIIRTHNMVVDVGLNMIRDLLSGTEIRTIDTIQVGHGTTAAVSGDTALETWHSTHSLYPTYAPTPGAQSLLYSFVLTTVDGEMGTLSEVGLFSGTVLYARATFAGIHKTVANSITFDWTLTWLDDSDIVLE